MRIDSSICAVVPVYNAQNTLNTLVEGLVSVLICFSEYQIILVDDHSVDRSFEIIKELCVLHANITGIRLAKNCGQQCAVFCGLQYSRCDYAVIIDDDLEQDPSDIMVLYSEILKGYDAVYGIGHTVEKGLYRGLGSKMRDLLLNLITKKPKDKRVCSFRIMNKKMVEKIIQADTRFVYISLEMLKYTNNIESILVPYQAQKHSNYRPAALVKLLAKMFLYYAPGAVWEKYRRKGPCFEVQERVKEEQNI